MRVSLDWLSEFVELPPIEELCEQLTMAGVEVEEVLDPSAAVSNVIVAEVRACEPHPDADRLTICEVSDGEKSYTVVCGAPNVAVGMRVPYAQVGAKLPDFEIKARKMRGVQSEGMLCGRSELGLVDQVDGLWELPSTWALGADIFAAAAMGPALELGITPNRPDLLSHLGIAREIAAATGTRMKAAKWRLIEKGPEVAGQARVVVSDCEGCPRYFARIVRGVKVGPSPEWLVNRLEQAGQRSINNVVDVTNYVMLELGQPLHAFDLARLAVDNGMPTIFVRCAKPDEAMETLDGIERKLGPEDMVIADADRVLALAGVMGGALSQVSDSTTDVLLECANFNPVRVRRTSKGQGLHTDSSHRFERGCDPGVVGKAIERCAQLLTELAGGEVAKGVVDVSQKIEMGREITLRLRQVPRILGIEMAAETVVQLLEPLDIRCIGRNEDSLRFQTPSFRPDLNQEVDLIEELARRHGFNQIPERLPDSSAEVTWAEGGRQPVSDVARQAMLMSGCTEAVNYAFGSPSHYEGANPLRLLNPLGEEMSVLRTTLLPGLFGALTRNQRQGSKHVRLFEIGTVFSPRVPADNEDPRDKVLPAEDLRVACVIYGGRDEGRWYESDETVDFSDLAGILENLIDTYDLQISIDRVPAEIDGFSPHATATLKLGGTEIGVAGQVHPTQAKNFGISGRVYAAELSLNALEGLSKREIRHEALPKYPGTRRDVAVIADRSIPAEQIRRFLAENAGGTLGPEIVEDVALFDVYRGKPISEAEVSLAFAINYRSRERTLTDAEVGAAFENVLASLKKEFGLEIR